MLFTKKRVKVVVCIGRERDDVPDLDSVPGIEVSLSDIRHDNQQKRTSDAEGLVEFDVDPSEGLRIYVSLPPTNQGE